MFKTNFIQSQVIARNPKGLLLAEFCPMGNYRHEVDFSSDFEKHKRLRYEYLCT